MKILRTLTLAAAIGATGCVNVPTQPHLEASNPASPRSPEAPFRTGVSFLAAGNNYAMPPEAEGQPMQMDMPEHGGMQTKGSGHEEHKPPSNQPKAGEQHQHQSPQQ